MPARLRPQPKLPKSILTVTSEPTWGDKKAMARTFSVSTRTIDTWRAEGWLPWTKVGGAIRFDIATCQRAFAQRFKNQRAISRRPLGKFKRGQADEHFA